MSDSEKHNFKARELPPPPSPVKDPPNAQYLGRDIEVPETHLNPRIWDISREHPAKLPVVERNSNFAEVESTLTRRQALCEANRCMQFCSGAFST